MAGKIFLNYRRGDDPGFTTALYIQLEARFGKDRLFMDVEGHIRPGDDFVEVLGQQVAACDVLLAIIGPRWETILIERGDDPDDFVLIEIEAALNQGKRVIPVLVGGAAFPRTETLPERIKPMARKNAVAVRPDRFMADAQGLIKALDEAFQAAEAARRAKTEAERAAADEARRRRESEEAARAAQIEAAARERAVAGLSAEEIRKAEELANWEFIKARGDEDELRDHLARFEGGVTARYAMAALDEAVWKTVSAAPDIASLKAYLGEFPRGAHARDAALRLAGLEKAQAEARAAEERRRRETEAWGRVAASTDRRAIEAFLKDWPDGQHTAAGRARLKELRTGGVTRRGLLKIAGASAVGVTVGSVAWNSAVTPGAWLWRQIYDESIKTLKGHGDNVNAATFSPDGKTIVSASGDILGNNNTLKLWDAASGAEIRTLTGHGATVTAAAFSAEGKTIVSGSHDNTLKLWDAATGAEIRTLTGHGSDVNAAAFSAEGKTIVSASDDKTLKLWDVSEWTAR